MSVAYVEERPWGGYLVLVAAYGAALLAGAACLAQVGHLPPLGALAAADLAATAVLFAFAFAFDNTAIYNAHWSLAPLAFAGWLAGGLSGPRVSLVLGVVGFYGLRLTFNWVRSWAGLHHEDFQYVDFRKKTGRWFWLVSLLAFHLFPMTLVVLASAPLVPAISTAPLGPWDWAAAGVAVGAVLVEWTADEQLRRFRRAPGNDGRFCDQGLWRWSRHPNYFGEVSFWVGLAAMGYAAGGPWWTGLGALGMCGLFVGASIPMADQRSLERRAGYAEYMQTTSAFVPWPPRER